MTMVSLQIVLEQVQEVITLKPYQEDSLHSQYKKILEEF